MSMRNRNEKRPIHVYKAAPKKQDIPEELTRFQHFKQALFKLLGLASIVGLRYAEAKVMTPILERENLALDNEMKRRELEKMEETVERVAVIESEEETHDPIDPDTSEEEQQQLLQEILELNELLQLKYNTSIELKPLDQESKRRLKSEKEISETPIVTYSVNTGEIDILFIL